MTMKTSGAWETRSNKSCRGFTGGSDPRIITEGADPHDPQIQYWYSTITGRMPLRWYIVAVCCGTIVILLGYFPWGILLMLLSPPRAVNLPRRSQAARCSGGGCPIGTGKHDER
jgi:hypothetical protein